MSTPLSGSRRGALGATVLLVLLAGDARAGLDDLQGTKPGDLAFPDFADADTCATCHGGGVMGDQTFLPSDTWPGTMMGNAARDPVFFAALTVANQDAPGIGVYCLRCHSPIGFVEGHAQPPDGSAFDSTDLQGVGCEACHRATMSPPPNAPYLLSDAQLVFTEDTAEHGPYLDAKSPAHGSVADQGLAEPRFCGQCHQVTNPEVHLLDSTGKDTGLEFPLDTTYEEWANSAYAGLAPAGCADCHMPRKAGKHPVTKLVGSPLRADPRVHALTGGNHWGIKAVMAANPDRAAQYPGAFARALAGTLDTLAKAVKVTLTDVPTSGVPGGPLKVTVRVQNLTGHKFPTGYAESRRAWIGISLVDGQMQERVLLGGYDGKTGHIQAMPKTRIYRAQHGRWDGQKAEAEEHLALHDMVISDTRIPPLGFLATPATMPSGEIDFSDGKGGYHAFDEVTFALTAPADASGDLTLSARVYYQSMTRDHIEFLRDANTTDQRGNELFAIYQATGEAPPLRIAAAEATVSFPGAGGAGGAGGLATGAGGTGGEGGSGGSGGKGGGGGCGCRAGGAMEGSGSAAIALLAVGLWMARRRRVQSLTARGTPPPA